MNFTREPIIETVITPRDGCKLVIRSSKVANQEEYQVDAVEVVSFGHSFFFRSLEKPHPFLVPVGDYEVLELKEVRMALKTASPERSIKIGGGRDAPLRQTREPVEERFSEDAAPPLSSQDSDRSDRKRDRRRRGRRGRDRLSPASSDAAPSFAQEESEQLSAESRLPAADEAPKPTSFISKLFPPPPTLIKESLGRYKHLEISTQEEVIQEEEIDEEGFSSHQKSEEEDNQEPRFEE